MAGWAQTLGNIGASFAQGLGQGMGAGATGGGQAQFVNTGYQQGGTSVLNGMNAQVLPAVNRGATSNAYNSAPTAAIIKDIVEQIKAANGDQLPEWLKGVTENGASQNGQRGGSTVTITNRAQVLGAITRHMAEVAQMFASSDSAGQQQFQEILQGLNIVARRAGYNDYRGIAATNRWDLQARLNSGDSMLNQSVVGGAAPFSVWPALNNGGFGGGTGSGIMNLIGGGMNLLAIGMQNKQQEQQLSAANLVAQARGPRYVEPVTVPVGTTLQLAVEPAPAPVVNSNTRFA